FKIESRRIAIKRDAIELKQGFIDFSYPVERRLVFSLLHGLLLKPVADICLPAPFLLARGGRPFRRKSCFKTSDAEIDLLFFICGGKRCRQAREIGIENLDRLGRAYQTDIE